VFNDLQFDSDGEGLGDACDGCPTVVDWTGAYTVNKWQSSTPVPYQPDSDDDGTPDACDPDAFGSAVLDLNGYPYNPGQIFDPGSAPSWGRLSGPPGSHVRIPVPLCDPDGDPDPSQITELSLMDLDATVEATLFDDDGLSLGSARRPWLECPRASREPRLLAHVLPRVRLRIWFSGRRRLRRPVRAGARVELQPLGHARAAARAPATDPGR
jgi:hypothetical protein